MTNTTLTVSEEFGLGRALVECITALTNRNAEVIFRSCHPTAGWVTYRDSGADDDLSVAPFSSLEELRKLIYQPPGPVEMSAVERLEAQNDIV